MVLMNGLGLAGKLNRVSEFISKCMALLTPNGQLLIDSSDISYLYQESDMKPDGYFGEVQFQYVYKGTTGVWFDWVYVDRETLKNLIAQMGLKMEVLITDENDQFLVRITKS